MSVELACECDDGFGVPHSHLYEGHVMDVSFLPGGRHPTRQLVQEDSGWVRIWVDWKAVVRGRAHACIGNDPTCPCQDGDFCHYEDTPAGQGLPATKGWPVP